MSEERTRIEQRLHDLLDTRDDELEKAQRRIEKLEGRLRGSETAWSMPRDIDDDHPDLPVPRLEMVWTKPDAPSRKGRQSGTPRSHGGVPRPPSVRVEPNG